MDPNKETHSISDSYSISITSFSLFFLLVSNKSPQLAYLRIGFLVEVKSVFLSISYLKQIIVKSFLSDADFLSSCLQRFLNVVAKFIVETCVEFSP